MEEHSYALNEFITNNLTNNFGIAYTSIINHHPLPQDSNSVNCMLLRLLTAKDTLINVDIVSVYTTVYLK
jgi:hypothetical protein